MKTSTLSALVVVTSLNSGITWNKDIFLEYIRDPKAKIPGTKMIFAGIKNEKEAGDLWAFLAQYDKDGKTK
jgi:cytochrome c